MEARVTQPTDQSEIVARYPTQIAAWKKWYAEHSHKGAFEEAYFESLALGFFIALGVDGDSGTGDEFYDASMLAFWGEEL